MTIAIKKVKDQDNFVDFQLIVSPDDFSKEILNWFEKKAKTIKLDGFRPGKAPLSLIKSRYLGDANQQVINSLLSQGLRMIDKEHKIKATGHPQVSIQKAGETDGLEYEVRYECFPNIVLRDFKEIECEELKLEVSEKEINDGLKNLLEKHEAFETEAKKGSADWLDKVKIILKEDKSTKNQQESEIILKNEQDSFFFNLHQKIHGKSVGDHFDCEIYFPKDYFDKKLADKKVNYNVSIVSIYAPIKFSLNDEFAKEFDCENLESLREKMKDVLQNDSNRLLNLYHKRHVLDALDTKYDVIPPSSLVDREFNFIWNRLQEEIKNAKERGEQQEDIDLKEIESDYKKIAARRVKLGLIISAVAESNNIELTKEEINQAIVREAIKYKIGAKEVAEFYGKNPSALDALTSPLIEDKVANFVFGKSSRKPINIKTEDLPNKLKGIVPGYGEDDEEEKSPKK